MKTYLYEQDGSTAMQTKDLVIGAAIVVLLILVIIFGVRSSTNAARAAEAENMSGSVVALLQSYDYPRLYPACRTIAAGRFDVIQSCAETALADQDLSPLFSEEKFQNADPGKERQGYLVIGNSKGGRTFESARFTLLFNNEPVATGCTTPGEIAPGYTCRLDFDQPCAPGDNLEVQYEGTRAHLRTC